MAYSVLLIDMAYREGEDRVVGGFPTRELAVEFARRRVHDSVKELRASGQSAEELRRLWFLFGEDAVVLGDGYAGSTELEHFTAEPAMGVERDRQAVKRQAGLA